jgi:hypothetical protein
MSDLAKRFPRVTATVAAGEGIHIIDIGPIHEEGRPVQRKHNWVAGGHGQRSRPYHFLWQARLSANRITKGLSA